MNEKWFGYSIAELEKKLKTNAASGLSPRAARSRRGKGAGQLFYSPRKPWWKIVFDIFSDFALIILILGAGFSLFFEVEEHLKGLTVLVIALLSLAFCGLVYYRSQRTLESLNMFFSPTVKVIRGGRLYAVDYRSVVVGDVILLEKGDVICADARLVSSEFLRVRMRVSPNEYIMLEKNAGTNIDRREIHAKNMSNMVHGGSVVLTGCARAIVCATGKYTYLGAMTGGISLPVSFSQPKLLERIRKTVSQLNMITLIAVLPFTMISLLLGNMLSERQSILSVAFLTALALAATTMPQLWGILMRIYYSYKLRKLATGHSPAVVRSVEAFDKLADADYVFMLDGSAVTDGILHLRSVICAEGEIRNFSTLNKTSRMFSEYAALYYSAATNTLTTGVGRSSDYISGIKEFINKTGADIDELKIRCEVGKYFAGNMVDTPEKIYFQDRGNTYCLSVWKDMGALQNCKCVVLSGQIHPLREEGRKSFERIYLDAKEKGDMPLIFALSSDTDEYENNGLLGIIILKEGIDPSLNKNIALLDRLGCKVISFTRRGQTPKLPPEITGRGCAVKASFERNKLPITYNFGSIGAYSDFSDEDIITLIEHAHSQNKKVAVIGFRESALKIARYADAFITCSDINVKTVGYFNEELQTPETAGQEGSSFCTQIVKERADCIIPRPKKTIGGLRSIISLLSSIRSMHRNISDFIRYCIATQISRLVIVGIPMLFGDAILDARHIMLCAFVLDLFAFFAFMIRDISYTDRRYKNYCKVGSIKGYFTGDTAMTVSSLVAAIIAVLLPRMADILVGDYDYKLEVLFTSLLLLQIFTLITTYYGNNIKDIRNIYKNKILLIEIIFCTLLWTLCFTVSGVGVLFGIEGFMSALYLILAIMPSVSFIVLFLIFNRKKQMKSF